MLPLVSELAGAAAGRSADPAPLGQPVLLVGLEKARRLNGEIAALERKVGDRWEVLLAFGSSTRSLLVKDPPFARPALLGSVLKFWFLLRTAASSAARSSLDRMDSLLERRLLQIP